MKNLENCNLSKYPVCGSRIVYDDNFWYLWLVQTRRKHKLSRRSD